MTRVPVPVSIQLRGPSIRIRGQWQLFAVVWLLRRCVWLLPRRSAIVLLCWAVSRVRVQIRTGGRWYTYPYQLQVASSDL